jgi:hypothetical protein
VIPVRHLPGHRIGLRVKNAKVLDVCYRESDATCARWPDEQITVTVGHTARMRDL